MVGDSRSHKILRVEGRGDGMTKVDEYTVTGEDGTQGANSETVEISHYFSPIYSKNELNDKEWLVLHTLMQV